MPMPSSERVSCDLEFAFDESDGEYYVLCGLNNLGRDVFRLSLAAMMIEPVVLIRTRVTPIMSPDGTIHILADELSFDSPIGVQINVEDLIIQAVDHKMLEDELEAQAMLQTLRKRLLSSLAAVDGAIVDLIKNQKS